MNNSVYEEYMRSVLGYQPMNSYNTSNMNYDNWEMPNFQNEELEECYPDIYRIVYPMIQKACTENARPLTRELIDSMTDEIYFAIEDKDMTENRSESEKKSKSAESTESRQTSFRNPTLRDIIRILLLREFLGRPGFPGGRPPRPRPPRPPMRPPMGPPRPQPRPGMGFNRYGQYDELYEY